MHSDSQKMGRGLRFSLFAPNARNAHGAHAQACMEFACPMCTHMNPEKAKTTALTAEAAACLYTLCAREKTAQACDHEVEREVAVMRERHGEQGVQEPVQGIKQAPFPIRVDREPTSHLFSPQHPTASLEKEPLDRCLHMPQV